jgi:hypothetical protein
MYIAIPIALYAALACTTVVPPPGQPVVYPPKPIVEPLPAPSWDFLQICTVLNRMGVQQNPSLNPPPPGTPQPKK